MSDLDYDTQVEEIKKLNVSILHGFQKSLEQTGLAKKTIKSHVENIDFFAEYLVYYEPLQCLDEADSSDVSSFLLDWFPRKAMWASVSSTKHTWHHPKNFLPGWVKRNAFLLKPWMISSSR